MEKKFLVIPGVVRSKWDGDSHWITASQLMTLYKVNPAECIIFPEELGTSAWKYVERNYKQLIKLEPQYLGDYSQFWISSNSEQP